MIELDDLDDLFDDLPFDNPSDEQLNEMRRIFEEDFIDNPFDIDGSNVKVITNPSWNREFQGEAETFVHLITRKSHLKGRRQFDRHRANRIHWIKPILLQRNDLRVRFFEDEDDKGVLKQHYWYEEGNHMVVVKPIGNDTLVVTGFVVDADAAPGIRRRYYEYRGL